MCGVSCFKYMQMSCLQGIFLNIYSTTLSMSFIRVAFQTLIFSLGLLQCLKFNRKGQIKAEKNVVFEITSQESYVLTSVVTTSQDVFPFPLQCLNVVPLAWRTSKPYDMLVLQEESCPQACLPLVYVWSLLIYVFPYIRCKCHTILWKLFWAYCEPNCYDNF